MERDSIGRKLAFPLMSQANVQGDAMLPRQYGMTLREYYIGQALIGVAAAPFTITDFAGAAKNAITIADAVLKALDESGHT
jgi:hypothetical protein